jgi:DNA-binding GntR family transcriptional regulator
MGHKRYIRSRAEIPAVVSATDKAYQAIRQAILTNELHAGEPVPVERFVRDLSLSRTPVREAILRLQREGLINIQPRMGTFVSHLDLRQIREMYELRRLLEGHAAKLATQRAPAEAIRELRRELDAFPTHGLDVDCKAISEAGQKLHQLILEHCGNLALVGMMRSMQDHFARFRSVSLTIPEKVISSHQEHLAILQAMERRDGPGAEQLIHRHFEHAAQLLLESLIAAPAGTAKITIAGR